MGRLSWAGLVRVRKVSTKSERGTSAASFFSGQIPSSSVWNTINVIVMPIVALVETAERNDCHCNRAVDILRCHQDPGVPVPPGFP